MIMTYRFRLKRAVRCCVEGPNIGPVRWLDDYGVRVSILSRSIAASASISHKRHEGAGRSQNSCVHLPPMVTRELKQVLDHSERVHGSSILSDPPEVLDGPTTVESRHLSDQFHEA